MSERPLNARRKRFWRLARELEIAVRLADYPAPVEPEGPRKAREALLDAIDREIARTSLRSALMACAGSIAGVSLVELVLR